jgi:glycosyltransferase involved in cell wall biosynthesis
MNNAPYNSFLLSIVVPMYNEEKNIDVFFSQLLPVIAKLTSDYEIICVNDGSTDATLEKLLEYRQNNAAIKVINLSRNFGKERALTAGLDYARGDAVVPIDADLQDPPELIEEMIAKWKEGFEVVYATRNIRRGESLAKRIVTALFYILLNKISEIPIPRNTGDFRLLDKKVVKALCQLPESGRFMKGLFTWVGFRQTAVVFDRQPRYAGKTSWNYWKLWNFALDGFTSFSFLPVRIWSYLGVCISLLSLIFAIYFILLALIKGIDVPGYASLMVVMLFLGGIVLIGLGIQGEYIGRIFNEVKKRPLYFVCGEWGVEKDGEEHNRRNNTK